MHAEKTVRPARGRCALSDAPWRATRSTRDARPRGSGTADVPPGDGRRRGAQRGRTGGWTYLHGLFANDAFRRAWLERVGAGAASSLQYEAVVDEALDAVADTLSAAVDLDALFGAARRPNVATGSTA